ncbi:hypothetical protein TELCIR_03658 [Teladorsagia circumcincta]|uniref:Uncharacterized protein n=1 Tax=Teladorsagia circumcincta TaxID=45464 RepID=A0A2G9UXA5_TELCI|nr:hypothetical protein TELCIR_03658 [Teladorsagia circumcincta]
MENRKAIMVGKFRHRIHGKAKSRIRKGFSSESNPVKKRHREAAASARVGSLSTGPMVAVDDRPEAADYLLNDLVLYTKMLENSESHEGSALKYLLSVLGVVLRAQPAGVWNVANTK